MSQNSSQDIFSASYAKEVQKVLKKDYLPKEITTFLQKLSENPLPNLDDVNTKIEVIFDEGQHAQGKSIFTREGLYPYNDNSKVIDYLVEILSFDYQADFQESEFIKALSEIKKNIDKDKNYANELLSAFLKEDEKFYQAQAENSSIYSFLCYFIANFAFLPFFIQARKQAEQANIKYDETIWQHGHCPYCGSAPLVSYLKEKEGKRVHACSTCLALYRAPRIQCPYCLEQKQENLNYFTVENENDCQICVCNTCKSYMKIFDYREKIDFNPHPLLDDYKTLTLDIISENQNYFKGVFSLWIF